MELTQPAKPKVFCPPPQVAVCEPPPSTACICGTPIKPTAAPCTVSIVFLDGAPHGAQLVPMEAHCQPAEVELAIAIMLARLLGAPAP